MKKWTILLLAVCLMSGFFLYAPQAEAAEHTDHCICGGSVSTGGHSCSDVTWAPVTVSSNKIVVQDGGHYYLTANTSASLTVDSKIEITLCLNGYRLQAQCPITVYGGVVNICDCQGTGYIRATNANNAKGSVIFISSSSVGYGTLNLYSGTITGETSISGKICRAVEVKGGVFNMYGGRIENGVSDGTITTDAKVGYGGNVCVYKNDSHEGSFTMYGGIISGGKVARTTGSSNGYGGNVFGGQGSHIYILGGILENGSAYNGGNLYSNYDITVEGAAITGGVAEKYRGNVYISGTVDLSKNTITGGTAGGKPETVRLIRNGVELVSDHVTLLETVNKMWQDANPRTLHLQLTGDVTENRSFTQDISMDLNGHNLSGITVCGTFYGMDTTGGGRLTCTLNGGQLLGIGEYMPVPEGDGSYSFHTLTATVSHISIDPANAAMGYKTQLYLPDSILERVEQFGYDIWLEGHAVRSYSKPFDQCSTLPSLRLKNILSPGYTQEQNAVNVDTPIHARPFVILDDGTKLCLAEVSYSFHDALEGADDHYSTYSQTQKTALRTLFGNYYYLIKYWHVENFHHMKSGTWSQLSSKGLLALAQQSSTPQGTYVLTEDVDLNTTTILLKEGADLTLCLDGHNITGAKQLFKIQGGQLTICDCHEGNDPGTLTSSLSGESGVYAPVAQLTLSGTMNLYGGQLKGQNLVRSAGVVAVGHQTNESSATFNMYGGSISDGKAIFNGGLVNVWHGSTFNMYGGCLYNGQCNTDGGGLVVRDGSVANLYGGQIYDCASGNNGGGIWAMNGGKCYLGNVKIYNNTAQKYGGNVYNNGTPDFTIDGASVTGGSAGEAGGIYMYQGLLRVTGTTNIRDNQNGDLWLNTNATLNADGLTQGADVRLAAMLHGKIGTDPAIAQYVTGTNEGYTVRQYGSDMVLWKGSLTQAQTIDQFSAGFGRACITPLELDVPLAGYGNTEKRRSTKVDGDLYVSATAITDEAGQTVLLMAADLSNMDQEALAPYLAHISYMTGVPQGNIIVTFSHTHSAPSITLSDPVIARYKKILPDLFAQAAINAMNDRKPAAMEAGSFDVEGLNFTRHYMFQDAAGVWQYSCDNFGERDLDSQINAQHTTDWDKTMHIVKFTRDGDRDILMLNWRAHPTLTGGTNSTVLSSDYVGALRDCFDTADVDMIFFQGASGNVNAVSRLTTEKHNLKFRDYGKNLYDQINTAMNSGCMQPAETGLWQVDNYTYIATVDHSDDWRYEEASKFSADYYAQFPGNQADQATRLAWCVERGWTCVFEASSIMRRKGMGQTGEMPLNTLALGDSLAFFTAPGELFDTVSVEMENSSKFDMTFCLGYSMGSHKYFVYDPATPDGSLTYATYEGFNRNYVAGTIKEMIAYWKSSLDEMYEKAQ